MDDQPRTCRRDARISSDFSCVELTNTDVSDGRERSSSKCSPRPFGVILRDPNVPVLKINPAVTSPSRTVSRIQCPKKCSKALSKWLCERCQGAVFFSLADWCFCYCGRYSVHAVEYRCNMPGHELVAPMSVVRPIPEERYNVAVICKAKEPRARWLSWVIDPVNPIRSPGDTFEVRQGQRVFQFADATEDGGIREFHAVCIVLPLYGNIRAQLFEAIAILGRNALKNIIVCVTDDTTGGANIKSLEDAVRSLNLGTETNFSTFLYGESAARDQDAVNEFLDLVCYMHPPIERQFPIVKKSSEDVKRLANALKNVCRLVEKSVSLNINLFAEDRSENTRMRTFILTSSMKEPRVVPELANAELLDCEFITDTDYCAEIFKCRTSEKWTQKAVAEELDRLQEVKAFFKAITQQLEYCLKHASSSDDAVGDRIHRIREDVLASCYRDEILEYLSAIVPQNTVSSARVVHCRSKSLLPPLNMDSCADIVADGSQSPSSESLSPLRRKSRGGRRRRARGGRNRGRGGRSRARRLSAACAPPEDLLQ
ncbi:hypothetical protein QR680_004940 [Steinernema hermaphroditum]|uniref:Uncharacterized protein n=1 Tax=Steinernema hermaphroditum TaxID=289476 RepID=A0AA39HQB3_9BILA|nr:hypothetical protein QR680_004940 [Steinernema hermaphroditum]